MKAGVDADVVEARLRELSRRLKRVAAKKPASLRQLTQDEDFAAFGKAVLGLIED